MHKFEILQSDGELKKTTYYLPDSIKCPVYSLANGCKGEVFYDAKFQGYVCSNQNCKCALQAEDYIKAQAEIIRR